LKALGWLLGVGSVSALSLIINAKTQIHEIIQTLISPGNIRDSTSACLGETSLAKDGQILQLFWFLSSVIPHGFVLKNNFSSTFYAVNRL
jgi:hypothetical protein